MGHHSDLSHKSMPFRNLNGKVVMGKGGRKLNPIPAVGAGSAAAETGRLAGENAR